MHVWLQTPAYTALLTRSNAALTQWSLPKRPWQAVEGLGWHERLYIPHTCVRLCFSLSCPAQRMSGHSHLAGTLDPTQTWFDP